MKPIITWILIADAGSARIVENRGAGKGLWQLENKVFRPPENNALADQEGRTFNSGSPARTSLNLIMDKSQHSRSLLQRFSTPS